jgi:hypothetical protein
MPGSAGSETYPSVEIPEIEIADRESAFVSCALRGIRKLSKRFDTGEQASSEVSSVTCSDDDISRIEDALREALRL